MGIELIERAALLPFDYRSEARRLEGESPAWLAALRRAALERFEAGGLPTAKHEEWRYTSLRPLLELSPQLVLGDLPERIELPFATDGSQPTLVFINGRYADQLSCTAALEGLEVADIATLIRRNDPRLEALLAEDLEHQTPFALLNGALFIGGTAIFLAPGAQISQTIHIVCVSDGRQGATVSNMRHLLVAGEQSRARIVESYLTLGAAGCFTNAVSTMHLRSGSSIEHVKMQDENASSVHLSFTSCRQEASSRLDTYNVCFGARLSRSDMNVYLDGSDVHTRMDGVIILDGEQHCDNHTRLDHAMPNCDSFEVYKHVLDGRSRAVFNGKIFVHQDAQKTDAKQTNQTLLLSRDAEIDTKPQLEIFADDVKCTHGATIGQVREDAMFYLRSRGIDERGARALLVYAFAAEVLERITDDTVRQELERRLFEKLQHAG